MKDKILVFIIGLLVGAVLTAGGFLIYEKVNKNTNQVNNNGTMQMMQRPDGETPPEKPSGSENDGGTPPEKPSDSDNDGNRPEPPTKKDSSSSNKTN